MKGAHLLAAVVLTFGFAACAPPEREPTPPAVDPTPGVETIQSTVSGCVMEHNDQLMLTQVQPAEPIEAAPVQAYQLVGQEQQIREFVGQRVEVRGEVSHSPMAQRTDATPGAVGTTGQPDDTDDRAIPYTDTQRETTRDTEATTFMVASVSPVAGECPAEHGDSRQ